MYVCINVCMHASMHLCMHTSMYLCMFICMCLCIYVSRHVTCVNYRMSMKEAGSCSKYVHFKVRACARARV